MIRQHASTLTGHREGRSRRCATGTLDGKLFDYHLLQDIAARTVNLEIAVEPEAWQDSARLSLPDLAEELLHLASSWRGIRRRSRLRRHRRRLGKADAATTTFPQPELSQYHMDENRLKGVAMPTL